MKHTHETTQILTFTPAQKKHTKICTAHQNIYDVHVMTYNFMYFF
jgi:hypothetical protein